MSPLLNAAIAGERSLFVILKENTPFVDVAKKFEKEGVRIQTRVPPRILTATFPEQYPLSQTAEIAVTYDGAVPIDAVRVLGPLATAAAVQWNRSALGTSRKASASAFGIMSADVSRQSLPPPRGLRISANDGLLHVSWDALEGALFYQIQLSENGSFSKRTVQSISDRLDVDLPMPVGENPRTLSVRVRGMDKQDSELNDMLGGQWTTSHIDIPAFNPPMTLAAVALSSPVDGFESEGLLVMLEWPASIRARLQIAEDKKFGSPLVDNVLADGEFTVPASLLMPGKTYFWRLQPWGSSIGPWSQTRSFKAGSPESVPNDMMINPEAPR